MTAPFRHTAHAVGFDRAATDGSRANEGQTGDQVMAVAERESETCVGRLRQRRPDQAVCSVKTFVSGPSSALSGTASAKAR